jgi:hypothetical protein
MSFLVRFVCLMMFNAIFNNMSVLLVEKTTDLWEVTDKLYHIMLYTSPWSRFTTLVVIGTDCIGSCKFALCCSLQFSLIKDFRFVAHNCLLGGSCFIYIICISFHSKEKILEIRLIEIALQFNHVALVV